MAWRVIEPVSGDRNEHNRWHLLAVVVYRQLRIDAELVEVSRDQTEGMKQTPWWKGKDQRWRYLKVQLLN